MNLNLIRRWILKNFIPEFVWPISMILDDVQIPLRRTPYTFGTKWLLYKKIYELEERILLGEVLKPGMHVIEMGSSIGILTAIVAEKIGSNGRIVAVEASSTLTAHSTKWLAKYPWCTVLTGFGFPVWKAQNISIDGFDEVRGSLGGIVSFSNSTQPSKDINIYDLEKICHQYQIAPELLLIDVEGSEQILLQTKPNFPASVTDIVIELHPGLYPNKANDAKAIVLAIEAEGFVCQQEMKGVWHFVRIKD